MAIVFHDSDVRGEFLDAQSCFYCGQSFDEVAIMWDGSSDFIWFHSDCFIKMAMGMFRDVHELELVQSISKYHGDTASDAYMQSIQKRIRSCQN